MFKCISILSIAVIFLLITTTAFAGTVQLPQTGQTKCYRGVSPYDEIPCAGTGQDGEIRAGAPWPNPRFSVNGDCVTDNLTGLMWPRNGDLTGWMDWISAIDYANDLTLCGYLDWRLPNVNELESLINADEPDTAAWLNTQGFTNIETYVYYWSSTTGAGYSELAWVVDMGGGYMSQCFKGGASGCYSFSSWPVRSGQVDWLFNYSEIWKTGQKISYRTGDDGDLEMGVAWPDPRFTVNGECVTDNLTGLMWDINANRDSNKSWQGALDYANNLTLCGYSDWRLPNRIELRSLIDYSNYNPPLPTGYPFTNVQSSSYWSSTNYTSGAWLVDMWNGSAFYNDKDNHYYVWPVRGGQVGSFGQLVISPDSYNYGNVNVGTTSPARTFTASNTGTANLEIYTISITGTDSSEFSIQNDYCSGMILAPSSNCTVQVVFSPSSYGSKSANISIPNNDPDTPVLDVPLSGTGIADVSGCIDLGGSPLANKKVILKQTGEVNRTTTTDIGGCYGFVDAVSGKSFTVQINGPVVTSPVPVIHGCADLQGSPMSGSKVLLKQKNELNKSTKTDTGGCYSFTNAVPDKNFKVLIKGTVMP